MWLRVSTTKGMTGFGSIGERRAEAVTGQKEEKAVPVVRAYGEKDLAAVQEKVLVVVKEVDLGAEKAEHLAVVEKEARVVAVVDQLTVLEVMLQEGKEPH